MGHQRDGRLLVQKVSRRTRGWSKVSQLMARRSDWRLAKASIVHSQPRATSVLIKYFEEIKRATRKMFIFLYRKFLDAQEGWSMGRQLMTRGSDWCLANTSYGISYDSYFSEISGLEIHMKNMDRFGPCQIILDDNYTLSFFVPFGPFWTVWSILDHLDRLDHSGPFWTILDCLDHSGPFGQFWTV